MSADTGKGTTAVLAEWAAGFRLEDAPDAVVDRMKALVLDFLRVVAVGVRMPWSRAVRRLALELGGKGSSTVLLCGDHLDAARAAFVNGAYAHACDLDDTHVGSMHHAGASILPAVLAMAEQEDADGRALLEAAICGYEASLRIGLATQPSLFQRGFMATPTCGALGAALAVGKLLNFSPKDLAGALGAAGAYAGGLAQFYPLRALFEDTVADALSTQAMAKVADLVAGLDRDSRPPEITTAFVAVPGWLERDG